MGKPEKTGGGTLLLIDYQALMCPCICEFVCVSVCICVSVWAGGGSYGIPGSPRNSADTNRVEINNLLKGSSNKSWVIYI